MIIFLPHNTQFEKLSCKKADYIPKIEIMCASLTPHTIHEVNYQPQDAYLIRCMCLDTQ